MAQLEEQIEYYLDYCKAQTRLDEKTLKAYEIDLRQFLEFSKGNNNPICKENIIQFIRSLHEKYKPRTVKRKIATTRAFLNVLEFEEIIEINPIHKIRLEFREPVVLPKSLPIDDVRRLLQLANKLINEENTGQKQKNRLRNLAILEILFATGLRVSELCSIHSDDINLHAGTIRVWGKGSRERIVYIGSHETLSILKQYKKTYQEKIKSTGWFFINRFGNRLTEQSVREMIVSYSKQAGIHEHVTPHVLRHTFATLMLEEDVDIRYIQSILGHSSISTTQIYTHISQNKQKLIMKNKHPRNKMSFKPAHVSSY